MTFLSSDPEPRGPPSRESEAQRRRWRAMLPVHAHPPPQPDLIHDPPRASQAEVDSIRTATRRIHFAKPSAAGRRSRLEIQPAGGVTPARSRGVGAKRGRAAKKGGGGAGSGSGQGHGHAAADAYRDPIPGSDHRGTARVGGLRVARSVSCRDGPARLRPASEGRSSTRSGQSPDDRENSKTTVSTSQ